MGRPLLLKGMRTGLAGVSAADVPQTSIHDVVTACRAEQDSIVAAMAKAAAKTRQCLLAGVCGPSGDGIVATRRAQHRAGGGWMAKRQAEEVAVHLSQDLDAVYAQPVALPRAPTIKDKLPMIRNSTRG